MKSNEAGKIDIDIYSIYNLGAGQIRPALLPEADKCVDASFYYHNTTMLLQ